MLSSHEVDTYGSNEHHFSLAHKTARLPIIQFLVESGLPSSALQIPDDSFTTPAMLAIQVQGTLTNRQLLVVRLTLTFLYNYHLYIVKNLECLVWAICEKLMP